MRNPSLALLAVVSVALLSAGVAGCHHAAPAVAPAPPAPTVAPAPPPPPPPPPPPAPPAPQPQALTEDELFARESLSDLNARTPLGDAFFDYDSAVLKPEMMDTLTKDAAWLRRWPTAAIVVSGHCDERGTAEYNLALGDRRAAAVKSYLVSFGIVANRITTVSYGKERPFCTENAETCWSRNRRAHFVVTAK